MPKEYIDREKAMEIVKRTSGDYAAAWSEIRQLPAADVAPVVHGEWVFDDHDEYGKHYKCSRCGEGFITIVPRLPEYCHCGAKMDGGKE